MGHDNFENHYIKIDELAIILAGKDFSQWYGFLSENLTAQAEKFTKPYIYEQMARLYQKGYVDWEDGMVKVRSPISELIDLAGKADFCIEIINPDDSMYKQIAYLSPQECIIMENDYTRKDTIKFSFWTKEEFLQEISNLSLFPEKDSMILLEGEEPAMGIKTEERGRLILRRIKTGSEQATLRIVEEGLYSYIHLQDTFQESIMPYRKELVREILKKWMDRKDAIV